MRILVGDVREQLATLEAGSVQCCVTSPPYWGLRDYGVPGQIGSERTPEEFVATMVSVFREVRRVLRDDGTLWLNLGDTYATGAGKVGLHPGGGERGEKWAGYRGARKDDKSKQGYLGAANGIGPLTQPNRLPLPGLKPKDLIGIPWRVALALQADGWYLRQEVIWHKPNAMPSSAKDRFCTAHESLFILTKSETYFFDWLAASEPAVAGANGSSFLTGKTAQRQRPTSSKPRDNGSRRFRRTVWSIATARFKGAHFATYPPALVEPCLLAGTSAHGACAECGAPWRRLVGKTRRATRPGTNSKVSLHRESGEQLGLNGKPWAHDPAIGNRDPQRHVTDYVTEGWERSCRCETTETRPCVVLDPFLGSGTTLAAAKSMGLDGVGIELNPGYAVMARQRLNAVQPRLLQPLEVG